MRPERWGRIEELCQEAASRDGDTRAAFLDEACGGDATLRREVESLLAGEREATGFLETPVWRAPALAAGTRLGPYEVVGLIGAGGMGEVYLATDTSLGRQVAIKVLPESVASDPERIARFRREAKTLASLNHPNIGAIYGLESIDPSPGSWEDGATALVLELVEGPTLADRIAEGPIPVEEALPLARQIVEALEAAHGLGIIHRDLKPANIKVREDGTVKVLDFGLAKALEAPDADVSDSSTMTGPATQAGVILGTGAYMSPEQATGRKVDRRSDVWAFGTVFYEMLTGRRAFEGDAASEVLAEIMKSEPNWRRLPALPPLLESFLRRCFSKDPRQRLPDIAAMRLALEGAFETGVSATTASVTAVRPAWRRALPLAAALIAGGLLSSLAWSLRPTPEPSIARFDRVLPTGQSFRYTWRAVIALSADGGRFVYNTTDGLFVRSMEDLEVRLIPGTEADLANPFFSPDGESVGYFDPATQQLKRTAVSGGAPLLICAATIPYGASWEIDDTILFGQPEGIRRVSATGGTSDLVIPARAGERIDGPHLLPDGDAVLFSATTEGGASGWDQARIVVQSLRTGKRTVVLEGGSDARYMPTGHLVYARANELFAVAFDADRLTLQGRPVRVVEGVTRSTNATAATAHYAVSDDGTLAYVAGLPGPALRTVVWIGRDGREEPLPIAPSLYFYPRMSPDGTRVALDDRNEDFDHGELWIWDFAKGTRDLLTKGEGGGNYPVWTPGGARIAYGNDAGGQIEWRAANGTDEPQVLVRRPDPHEGSLRNPYFFALSPSGLELVFRNWYEDPQTGNDIFKIAVKDGAKPVPVLSEAFDETNAELSPNGRWMAYQSDESGQDEIYVRPYPNANANRVQVSAAGGTKPLWSHDGSELFYLQSLTLLISVAVDTEGTDFSLGRRLPLPAVRLWSGGGGRNYDVSPDGRKFLVIKPVPAMAGVGVETARSRIIVAQNWFGELKTKVPTRR